MLEASFNSTRDAEMPLASAAQRTPLTCWSEVAAYLIVQGPGSRWYLLFPSAAS